MNTHMDEPLNKPYHSVEPSEGRFAALLSTASCMRPVYDKILFEVEHCVVTPTLGSILPHWLWLYRVFRQQTLFNGDLKHKSNRSI